MIKSFGRAALVLGVFMAPVVLSAQPSMGGEATQMLNARRQLDLTPRQVAQLDSLERVVVAERRARMEEARARMQANRAQGDQARAQRGQARAQRDSVRPDAAARRAQMEAMRTEATARREAAERVLSAEQRQKWTEMRAEARGYQRGVRAARGAAMGNRAQGMRQGRVSAPRAGQRGMQFQRPGQRRPAAGVRVTP